MKALLIIILITYSISLHAIEVSNFKFGLACTDGKTFGWICHEKKDIYITGQSQCNWSGEVKPCTWFGYEFDYKNNNPNTSIKCDFKTSEFITEGNFEGIRTKDSKTASFEFKLDKKEGHFFNPQYYLFSVREKDRSIVHQTMVCKYEDKEVFSFEFNGYYPVSE